MSTEPTVHICTPRSLVVRLRRFDCSTCERRRYGVSAYYEWYGESLTCLRCGERWGDGEMLPRPFMPRWRVKSVDDARKFYRRCREGGVPTTFEDVDPVGASPDGAG